MKETENLAHLILPKEIFVHFEIVATQTDQHQIHIYLDQKNIPPVKHHDTYKSKINLDNSQKFLTL